MWIAALVGVGVTFPIVEFFDRSCSRGVDASEVLASFAPPPLLGTAAFLYVTGKGRRARWGVLAGIGAAVVTFSVILLLAFITLYRDCDLG